MPPPMRPAIKVGGRRIAQGRKRRKNKNASKQSVRQSLEDIDSEEDAYSETAEDVLDRSPHDEPECISRTTQRSGMFWAPLMSGSTPEEKDLMQPELAAAGKFQFPETRHPEYVQTRLNDPANLNRQLFFEGQDPDTRLVIAGVPNAPLILDPPGTRSPFDALKHPKSLIARLNRVPDDLDGMPYGWDDRALKNIPHSIIAQLPPKTLASLPASVRSTLAPRILSRLPVERAAGPMLLATGRLTRPSQHLSNKEQWTAKEALEELLSATGRSNQRSQRYTTDGEEEETSILSDLLQANEETDEPVARPMLPANGKLNHQRRRLFTQEEETATGDLEEPSAKSVLPALSRLHRQSQPLPIEEEQDETSNLLNLPATDGRDEYRLFDEDEDIDHEDIEEDEDEETLQLKLGIMEKKLMWKRIQHSKARSQAEPSGATTQHRPTSAIATTRPHDRDGESSASSVLPAICRPNNYASQRLSASQRLMRDSGKTPAPLTGPEGLIRSRRSQATPTNDPPTYPSTITIKRFYKRKSTVSLPSTQPSASRRRGGGRSGKSASFCDHCHIKRVKCDGIHPSCTPCDNFGVRCSLGDENEPDVGEQPEAVEEQPEAIKERGEPAVTSVAAGIDRDDSLMTDSQRDGAFDTVGDIGPIFHGSDADDEDLDFIDFEDVRHRAFIPRLGITKEFAGRFIYKSTMDHLSLQENTAIPLKFHSKPVFLQMTGSPKNTRLRTAHAYHEMRLPQEETFMTRPSVRIVVPDHLKNLLVDDWENVTKSLLVVPLPSKAPVNFIIDSYFDEEKGKRRLGSAEADVLEEFVAGMKVYFDKAIGKTLLYKFERPQWAEVRNTAMLSSPLADAL